MCIRFGKQITYTPKQTSEYEKLVKASYMAVSKIFFKKDIPLEIDITAFYGEAPQQIRNKDVCKNEIKITRNEKYLATKKPDSDNIIKIILDGLNKVAYHDDAQIGKLSFEKRYSKIPRVEVKIKKLEEKSNMKATKIYDGSQDCAACGR